MSCLWLDGYESAMHETFHITDAVKSRNLFLDIALLIVEQLDRVGYIQIVIDRIFVAIKLLAKQLIIRCLFSEVFDEVGNLYMTLVLPRIRISPVGIECLLHLFHLFDSSILSVFLHTCVDGGVNLQTFSIICILSIVTIIVFTPVFHPVAYSLTEVVGFTIIGILHAVVKFNLNLFQRVTLLLCQMSVLPNQVKHHVSTSQ